MTSTGQRAWRALTTPPGAISTPAVVRGAGVVFALGTVLTPVLAALRHGPDPMGLAPGPVAVMCGVVAVVLLAVARRAPTWVLAPPLVAATALVGAAARDAPSPVAAVSITLLLVIVVVVGCLLWSWLSSGLLLGLTTACAVWAVRGADSVGAADEVVLAFVLATSSVLTGWVVRATASAEVDQLTGLLNRRGVERRVAELVRRSGGRVAVALLDLDHFKEVNDTAGHHGGDRLLRLVASALQRSAPRGAVLGRWGGDEFVALMPGAAAADLRASIEGVRAELPDGRSTSAGVAEGSAGTGVPVLLAQADAALYRAKRHARGTTQVHGEDGAAADVRAAIARGHLEVFFQPVVDLVDDDVIGAEALVRWRHPQRGLLAPDAFLPQAEADGSVVDLGAFVLALACSEAAAWPRRTDGGRRSLGVNASGQELEQPDYAQRVLDALAASGLPPASLVLEISEGVLDVDEPVVRATLEALHEAGVHLGMDDFGTGYSSLGRLAAVPLEVLKVDRVFTAMVSRADDDVPLLTAVLAMAHALGLDPVVEGVETAEQARWLAGAGCRRAQGYLFGRPVPHAEFRRRLGPVPARVPALGVVATATAPAQPMPRAAQPSA